MPTYYPSTPPADTTLQNSDTYLPPSIPDPRSTKIRESPTKLRYFIENPYPNLQLLDTTYLPTPTTYPHLLDTAYLPTRTGLPCLTTLPWKKYATLGAAHRAAHAAMVAEVPCNLAPRHPPSQVLDNLPRYPLSTTSFLGSSVPAGRPHTNLKNRMGAVLYGGSP